MEGAYQDALCGGATTLPLVHLMTRVMSIPHRLSPCLCPSHFRCLETVDYASRRWGKVLENQLLQQLCL